MMKNAVTLHKYHIESYIQNEMESIGTGAFFDPKETT
jgi:hypothetical protein